jgi:hypothetical protein
MLHLPAFTRVEPELTPADRSMAILQYLVAGVALVVALALTFGH